MFFNAVHIGKCSLCHKDNVVISICSLHNRPDNYLKGIINSTLKGFNDSQESKSKVAARWIVVKCNKQKGNTECEYYYFTDSRPLESERIKAIRIQWTRYYLKVNLG
ncbi:hypothetical protein GmHk_08G023886 [Glycine max]|nr:hypothetical protein GmHk_08G023886 [Glycine max]